MTKRAIVIGIDDYSVQGQPILHGCVRDAKAFYHLLVDAFGFEASNIFCYLDLKADSATILKALRYCVAQSQPGDVICFYYSGHGARLPHPKNAGEFYETIVPASGQWISDHEMYLIADQLQPSYTNFTVVLDSCHSGGMSDETNIKSPLLAQALIDKIIGTMRTLIPCGLCLDPKDRAVCVNNVSNVRRAPSGLIDLDSDPNKILIKQAKTTLIAGCRSNELSYLSPSGAATKNSLLTQAFLDLVDSCPYEIDHHTLIEKTGASVSSYMKKYFPGKKQTPELRGQSNRMGEIFLAPFTDSR
jgi:Caspase domain